MKDLTVLIPCLNEAPTLLTCIQRAQKLIETSGLMGEILIADNGSTDGSREIATAAGARVVLCQERGYGAALLCGLRHSEGTYIVMGDADDSYHFDEALPLIHKLEDGFDVCMGTRIKGTILPGAMPLLHRRLGTPAITFFGNLLFRTGVSDFNCGLRAFRRDKILALDLVATGMEWATEMLIVSRLAGYSIAEVPITLHKDGRIGPSHLKPWCDGCRHLCLMFMRFFSRFSFRPKSLPVRTTADNSMTADTTTTTR